MKKLFMRLLRLAIPLAAVFALSNLYATEIFKAIQQGDLEKLQQVIPPGGVDTVTSHSDTPLCYAIRCNNLAMVKVLVEEHEADVNFSANSLSPLMCAATFGTLPIAQFLVEQNADLNKTRPGYHNYTALCQALVSQLDGAYDIARFLINAGTSMDWVGDEQNLLMLANTKGAPLDILQLLITHGANVNYMTPSGCTPLIAVIIPQREPARVQLLIDNEADVNHVHDNFGSALHAARQMGRIEAINILLEACAEDIPGIPPPSLN